MVFSTGAKALSSTSNTTKAVVGNLNTVYTNATKQFGNILESSGKRLSGKTDVTGGTSKTLDDVTPVSSTNLASSLLKSAQNNPLTTATIVAGGLGTAFLGNQLLNKPHPLPLEAKPFTNPLDNTSAGGNSSQENNPFTSSQSFLGNGSPIGGFASGSNFGGGYIGEGAFVSMGNPQASPIPTADAFGVGIGSRTDLKPLSELPTGNVNMNISPSIGSGIGSFGIGIGGFGIPPFF